MEEPPPPAVLPSSEDSYTVNSSGLVNSPAISVTSLDPSSAHVTPPGITPPGLPTLAQTLISAQSVALTAVSVAVSTVIPPVIVPPVAPSIPLAPTAVLPPPMMPLAPLASASIPISSAVPAAAPHLTSSSAIDNPIASSVPVPPPSISSSPIPPPVIPFSIPRPPFVPPIALPSSRPVAPPPFVPPVRPMGASGTLSIEVEKNDEQDRDADSKQESPSSSVDHQEDSLAPEYEITEESKKVRERQEQAVQELLMRRRAYALAVPTNDSAVRARLRRLNEPVTLFGEREMERRDRLRAHMAKLDAEGQLEKLMKVQEEEEAVASLASEEVQDMEGPQIYPFYTEGSQELLKARTEIMKFSLPRAVSRIQRARRKREDPDEDEDEELNCVLRQAAQIIMDCSEIGDDRPLSGCSFSSDATLLATRNIVKYPMTLIHEDMGQSPMACFDSGHIVDARSRILWSHCNLASTPDYMLNYIHPYTEHETSLKSHLFHPNHPYGANLTSLENVLIQYNMHVTISPVKKSVELSHTPASSSIHYLIEDMHMQINKQIPEKRIQGHSISTITNPGNLQLQPEKLCNNRGALVKQ
eukprot:Gb_29006 [translate_table: standard]